MKKIYNGWLIILLVALTNCKDQERFYSNVLRSDTFYQTYDEAKYDFLWVMDNSGSMTSRRAFIRDNMQSFLNILNSRKAVDYQMAMTSVDMFTDAGKLVQDNAGHDVVLSSSASPVSDFAGIINNVSDSITSFWEQPLESMYQAISLHGSRFSRMGVPLIIIIVTDSNDWSCQSDCFGGPPETHMNTWTQFPISRYIKYLETFGNSHESDISVFPITGTTDEDCGYEVTGDRMIALQEGVGNLGVTGSICPDKLADSYNAIAQVIADRGTVFHLSSSSNGRGINVYVDRQLIDSVPENFIFDEASNSIIFTGAAPKKGQLVEVTYVQKTTK